MSVISIKEARKRKQLTQAELADLMGVHQTNVVAWERGKWLPRAKKLQQLATVLDCTIDELLDSNSTDEKE